MDTEQELARHNLRNASLIARLLHRNLTPAQMAALTRLKSLVIQVKPSARGVSDPKLTHDQAAALLASEMPAERQLATVYKEVMGETVV